MTDGKSSVRNSPARKPAVAAGYRSAFEMSIAGAICAAGQNADYEAFYISYLTPQAKRKYKPDFRLDNGIIIETKGIFSAADRRKHLLVREDNPQYDIRFVFQNANAKLSKKSKMTYGGWAKANGFLYAHKTIPAEWLTEEKK